MGVVLTFDNGVTVRQGEKYEFPDFHALQRMVMPVVSIDDWTRSVLGHSGLHRCWLVRHRPSALDDLDREGAEDIFVLWETDTEIGDGSPDALGSLLRIRTYSLHDEADLATLTAERPEQAPGELRKLDWSLRMPRMGKPVAVVGYSHLRGELKTKANSLKELAWERVLSIGVGAVLEQRIERRGIGLRQSPGFSQ